MTVQAAFVGGELPSILLNKLRLTKTPKHENRTSRYYNQLTRIFRARFFLNDWILVGRSRYYNMLAGLRLYKELLNSTYLFFRPKKST